MKSLKKYIGLFFILLSGILISAHELIPHHHHFDSVYSHTSHSPSNNAHNNEHREHEDSSSHCHAFNDSFIDRILTLRIRIYPQPDFTFASVLNSENALDAFMNFKGKYIQKPVQPERYKFPVACPLRAPPLFI